jgi:hypothetical protein
MSSFGKIAWIGHIWLTALMTLVAGMPHFACRCPDGNVKPVCMGTLSAKSGCCCSGTCCSSFEGDTCCCGAQSRIAADQVQTGFQCCQHQDRQTKESRGNRPEVGHNSCTKTLAPSVLLTVSHGKTTIAKPLTDGALLPAQAVTVLSLTTMVGARSAWQAHQIAPPTDLVTALQRFLI